jgi:DNA-binding LytR/AlgR family response regulator
MADKRFLTIHFTDGSKLSVTFPKQTEDIHQVASRVQNALDANQLAIEISDELFVIPMNNIKYLQVSPGPAKLPKTVIRGGALKSDY